MKEAILDISEITHSREMYNAKPRPFVSAFIYIFVFIIIGAITYTYFGSIDIVVKGSGVVRPNENLSTISSGINGNIESMNVYEGKEVQVGDVLYMINHDYQSAQLESLQEQLSDVSIRLEGLATFKVSIEQDEDLFKYASIYHNKYLQYLATIEYTDFQLTANELQYQQMSGSNLVGSQLIELKKQRNALNEIKTLIQEGTDIETVGSENERYLSYISNMTKLTQEYNEANLDHERGTSLYNESIISLAEFESFESTFKGAELNIVSYESNYMVNLEQELNNINLTITSKQMEYDSAVIGGSLLDNELLLNEATQQKQKMDTIVGLESEIESAIKEKIAIKNNIELIGIDIEKSIIKAPIAGKLSILSEVAIGDILIAGTNLVSIIPPNEDKYKVQIMIANKDVADIHVGDKIKFNFQALPHKDYGYLTGIVTNISTDIKSNSQVSGFYLVEAKLDSNEVANSENEIKAIKMGMTSEAHIVTEQKQILKWLLEKIDLLD